MFERIEGGEVYMKYRIVTAWGISDKSTLNLQYSKKGLFGKERWKTVVHYTGGHPFPTRFNSIEEAKAGIKKKKERDNFVSGIIVYEE